MSIKTMPQLSWSKINLFLQCPRCFYKVLIRKLKRPDSDPDCFALNNAVDILLKNEFDLYRERQEVHPLMMAHNIPAVPYDHTLLPVWRDYRAGGIRYFDHTHNLELCGVIDDVLITPNEELIIIDYKASTKDKRKMLYNSKWNVFNARQLAFYAHLFKKNGFPIHKAAYFIYANALSDKSCFKQILYFEMEVEEHLIDGAWLTPTLQAIRKCLDDDVMPVPNNRCDFCKYDVK